jgi:hypothetical protein
MGTFASVKPYSLRLFFHLSARRYPPRMGSYPRREKAEREARERAAMQPALDCQACGALTPGALFRYCGDRVICEACNQQNPQSRVRTVQRELLAPRDICLNVIQRNGYTLQAMAADYRTSLGPFVPVQSAETLRRLLAYLGATPRQLADFESVIRRWGQGTVKFTLQPCRKNLLRLQR